MKNEKKLNTFDVVVAVHDELFGNAIVDFIEKHMWPYKVRFHVIHVIENNLLKNPLLLPQESVESIDREEQQGGWIILNHVARRLYASIPGIRVRRYLKRGSAKREILSLANQLNASFVVLGSHGRQGVERLMLGSVANEVVVNAPCSTVVVRLAKQKLLESEREFGLSTSDLPERMQAELGACCEWT